MKMREEFVVAEPPATLWEFFEQVDRVARCVPGVEEVTVVDADNSRVRVTQAVGPMSATFDLKMRITDRDPGRSMEFTAIGRSVRGAAGNVRSTNTVALEAAEGGGTRVTLDGDVALGGMLGSVGQKVVAKQAGKVTRSFAEALERELSGNGAAEAAPAARAAEPPVPERRPQIAPAPAPLPAPPPRESRASLAAAAAAGAAAATLVLWLLRRLRA
jgi:carbon monoxide dehydrogenase subunit G